MQIQFIKLKPNWVEHFNWIILIIEFNKMLNIVINIYPFIPNNGSKKNMPIMLRNKSNILQSITPTCLSNPFKILSTTLSKYKTINRSQNSET